MQISGPSVLTPIQMREPEAGSPSPKATSNAGSASGENSTVGNSGVNAYGNENSAGTNSNEASERAKRAPKFRGTSLRPRPQPPKKPSKPSKPTVTSKPASTPKPADTPKPTDTHSTSPAVGPNQKPDKSTGNKPDSGGSSNDSKVNTFANGVISGAGTTAGSEAVKTALDAVRGEESDKESENDLAADKPDSNQQQSVAEAKESEDKTSELAGGSVNQPPSSQAST